MKLSGALIAFAAAQVTKMKQLTRFRLKMMKPAMKIKHQIELSSKIKFLVRYLLHVRPFNIRLRVRQLRSQVLRKNWGRDPRKFRRNDQGDQGIMHALQR